MHSLLLNDPTLLPGDYSTKMVYCISTIVSLCKFFFHIVYRCVPIVIHRLTSQSIASDWCHTSMFCVDISYVLCIINTFGAFHWWLRWKMNVWGVFIEVRVFCVEISLPKLCFPTVFALWRIVLSSRETK